jgi:hypothetical protein
LTDQRHGQARHVTLAPHGRPSRRRCAAQPHGFGEGTTRVHAQRSFVEEKRGRRRVSRPEASACVAATRMLFAPAVEPFRLKSENELNQITGRSTASLQDRLASFPIILDIGRV